MWHIVVSLVSGIFIGIIFSYITWCSRRCYSKNRKPTQNSERQTADADSVYQEVDLSKMNVEDNNQSQKGNATTIREVANDEYSELYIDLSKVRDDENKYQSLIKS